MKRNLRALEHKGEIYLHLDDLAGYLRSLAEQTNDVMAKRALHEALYKLQEVRSHVPAATAQP